MCFVVIFRFLSCLSQYRTENYVCSPMFICAYTRRIFLCFFLCVCVSVCVCVGGSFLFGDPEERERLVVLGAWPELALFLSCTSFENSGVCSLDEQNAQFFFYRRGFACGDGIFIMQNRSV